MRDGKNERVVGGKEGGGEEEWEMGDVRGSIEKQRERQRDLEIVSFPGFQNRSPCRWNLSASRQFSVGQSPSYPDLDRFISRGEASGVSTAVEVRVAGSQRTTEQAYTSQLQPQPKSQR